MDDLSLCATLQLWNYAGERPYEVLIQEGVYDQFVDHLKSQTYDFDQDEYIYRGTRRHSELEIGGVLEYTYPTSWTLDRDMSMRFIEGESNGVILAFRSDQPIMAMYNEENSYEELEVIVYPITLIVIAKHKLMINNQDVTILYVNSKR